MCDVKMDSKPKKVGNHCYRSASRLWIFSFTRAIVISGQHILIKGSWTCICLRRWMTWWSLSDEKRNIFPQTNTKYKVQPSIQFVARCVLFSFLCGLSLLIVRLLMLSTESHIPTMWYLHRQVEDGGGRCATDVSWVYTPGVLRESLRYTHQQDAPP